MPGQDHIHRSILDAVSDGNDRAIPRHGRSAIDGILSDRRAFVDDHDLHATPSLRSRSDSVLIVSIAGKKFSPAVRPPRPARECFPVLRRSHRCAVHVKHLRAVNPSAAYRWLHL